MIIDERHLAEKFTRTQAIVDCLVGIQGYTYLDLTLVDDVGAIAKIPVTEDFGPGGVGLT